MQQVNETTKEDLFLEKENWELKKQKLREKFPELTDEDLNFEDGKEDGLFERIHSKIGDAIGKTKDGLHKFINSL
jgi:uncharacterized protein YjbJ (UPF0337 family)